MRSADKQARVRVAIYCRISLAKHGDLVKVERQEADCRALCKRLGWEVVFVFVDNNKSAWQRDRRRPDWDALLEAVDAGDVDAIVVYHGDRLIRQPWDLELLLRLADEKNIKLASPIGTRNLQSADDRYILRIEAATACRESDNTSRRTKRGKEARRARGEYTLSGTRAFGREIDGSLRHDEADVIREIVPRLLAGESKVSLWREINTRRILTPTGKQWLYTSFHQMLERPDLAALIGHQGKIVGQAKIDPIIDRETWEALQAALAAKRSGYPSGPRPRKHLLTNYATCGSCSQGLKSAPKKQESLRQYRCDNHECSARVGRNAHHLDEYVIAATLEILGDQRIWAIVDATPTDGGIGAELTTLQARRASTIAAFADDEEAEPADLRAALRGIDEKIKAVQARIAATSGTRVLAGLRDLDRDGWDALPLSRQRAIVSKLLTVKVYPTKRRGRGFDTSTVEVKRRALHSVLAGSGDLGSLLR